MKHLWIIVAVCLLAFTACKNEEKTTGKVDPNLPSVNNPSTDSDVPPPNADQLPVLTFEKEEHDFGTIKEGEVVMYDFKFTNTGKTDMIISNARGSCGCTQPEWPREPIAPGKSGVMKVGFNSTGKPGQNKKAVTIIYNGYPSKKVIYINANVLGNNSENKNPH